MENDVVNDDGLPLHVDEVCVCDLFLISLSCDVTNSFSQVMRRKDRSSRQNSLDLKQILDPTHK